MLVHAPTGVRVTVRYDHTGKPDPAGIAQFEREILEALARTDQGPAEQPA